MNGSKYISGFLAWLLIGLVVLSPSVYAQDETGVSFTANVSKKSLGINERLKVTFVMNKDGDNFVPPNFQGFDILIGPMQSISSSWINGKRSYSKSYTYTLRPQKQGNFSIGQASIEIDGKTYKTSPVAITVTRAVDNPNAPPSPEDLVEKGVFLVTELSTTNPYLNEAVSVTYRLYISSNTKANSFNPVEQPKYPDFWSQNFPIDKYEFKNVTYKGEPYISVELSKAVLYPQKAGKLVIEPLSIDVFVEVPTNRRDFFGRREYVSATKRITAPARTVNVKPLPTAGQTESFNGAVGSFEFEVTPSRTDLEATESLQINVTVSGKGNLKLFQLPELVLPSSLEVYEPELNQNVRTLHSGLSGSVTQSYTVIPQYGGRYPIPEVEFSYFDPSAGVYRTLRSKESNIQVSGNAADPSGTGPAVVGRNRIQAVTADNFHFIKIRPDLKKISNGNFLGSLGFYLGLLVPMLFIPVAVWWKKNRMEAAKDHLSIQRKKAHKLVKRHLSEARTAIDSEDDFYIALEKALYNFIKAKLHLDTAQITKDQIREEFRSRGLDEKLGEAFLGLLETCEMARYSPLTQAEMKRDYDKAAEVIPKIDKSL